MSLIDTAILDSKPRASSAQARAYLVATNAARAKAKGVAPLSYDECRSVVASYWASGTTYAIAPDAALAQSILETDAYTFGGQVNAAQHNVAGLGATNDGASGGGWPTWAAGIAAQFVHLLAWCGDRRGDADYRIAAVRGELAKQGKATTWRSLGGRWAVPGTTYGDGIEQHWQGIVASKGATPMQQFADTVMELTPGSNRPGDRLVAFDAFVVHETDNENTGAGVMNTWNYLMGTYNGGVRPQASFNFCTDGIGVGHSAQFLPAGPNDAEACWAIGDGQDSPSDASNRTVSGEICVNKDGDYNLACTLMTRIVARVLHAHGKPVVKDVTVRQHGSYYSAANPQVHRGCPKHLKAGDWGWTWDRFVAAVQAEYTKLGGGAVDQSQKIAQAVTPSQPDGYMPMHQADTFDWEGEGVIVYRKVRYYNPQEGKWYEREWSSEQGFTPWQQVA